MTKQELEQLKNLAQKLAEKRKSYEQKKLFQEVLKVLDKVPTIEGKWVQRTANDFFGRSWEKGLKVEYKTLNGNWKLLKHNADVSYQHIFPWTQWKEQTDKTIAEQLFELFTEQEINYDTEIKFEFRDFKDKTYDNSKTIIIPLKKILPEILQIVEKNLPSDLEESNIPNSEKLNLFETKNLNIDVTKLQTKKFVGKT